MDVRFPLDKRLSNRYLVSKVEKAYKNDNQNKEKEKHQSDSQKKGKQEKDEGFQRLL